MIKTGYEDYITLSFIDVCNPPDGAHVRVVKGEAMKGKVFIYIIGVGNIILLEILFLSPSGSIG